MRPEPTKVLNVTLAADVKEALVADAAEQGASINDVGVSILAAHFRIKFRRSGRPHSGSKTEEGAVLFRVPAPLWRSVHRAAMPPKSKTAVVEEILREHYLAVAA